MINYILFALSAGILWAISIVADDYITTKIRNATFLFLSSVSSLLIIALIQPFTKTTLTLPIDLIGIAFLTGILYSIALYSYFEGIRRTDTAITSQITASTPVITIILAIIFLNEILTTPDYIGITLVLASILIASIKRTKNGNLTITRNIIFIIFPTILWAITAILTSYTLNHTTTATFLLIERTGALTAATIILIERNALPQIKNLIKTQKTGTLSHITLNELINAIGLYASFIAYETGPASIVNPLTSTTPIFVLLITTILVKTNQDTKTMQTENPLKLTLTILLLLTGITLITYP